MRNVGNDIEIYDFKDIVEISSETKLLTLVWRGLTSVGDCSKHLHLIAVKEKKTKYSRDFSSLYSGMSIVRPFIDG